MDMIKALQTQINRCRQLLKEYESLGPAGNFGAHMIKYDLKRAEDALSSHDVIEIIASCEALASCK